MAENINVKTGALCFFLSLLMVTVGCIEISGWSNQVKCEKVVHLTSPITAGSKFTAQTHNGAITFTGTSVADCNITATIIAYATTEEYAETLVEQTEIELEHKGNDLAVNITRPTNLRRASVSVNLDVRGPDQCNLSLTTHNGSVTISNITGTVEAETHNGGMNINSITGSLKLVTHNGGIKCDEISGNSELRTHNGKVEASYSDSAPMVCDISAITHNGGVEMKVPPEYSAKATIVTHNGSINTDQPIVVIGKVSRNNITGTIRDGQGTLHLETHNGSIKLE